MLLSRDKIRHSLIPVSGAMRSARAGGTVLSGRVRRAITVIEGIVLYFFNPKNKTASYFSSKNELVQEQQRIKFRTRSPDKTTSKSETKGEEALLEKGLPRHWRKPGVPPVLAAHWPRCGGPSLAGLLLKGSDTCWAGQWELEWHPGRQLPCCPPHSMLARPLYSVSQFKKKQVSCTYVKI